MAKIGITLDEVLRSFIEQFEYVYNKYKPNGEEINLPSSGLTSYDLINYFPFSGGTKEMNRFLYNESALEIFGHADELEHNLINKLNELSMDFEDDGIHEIWIVSREVSRSIPATMFFLSKTGCMINKIRFVSTYEEMWENVDVLITANPFAIECKPKDKIVVKIKRSFNKDHNTKYEIDSLFQFMNDEEFRNNILPIKEKNEIKKLPKHWWSGILCKFFCN